jgi:U4/U6.U5 tri-snRNP-associated protein 3
MAEPPHKRARRPDSKQMWDDSDRRAPIQSRERDEPAPRERERRDDRRDDRDRERDRNRRYRSRSPRRDERDRDRRGGRDTRGGGRGRDERDDERGGRRGEDRGGGARRDRGESILGRVDLVVRSRSNTSLQDRGRDGVRERERSRSPRRERELEKLKVEGKVLAEEEFMKSRTATPPVSFKVGEKATGGTGDQGQGQDHDRMDVESGTEKKDKRKGKKGKAKSPPPEDDEDIMVDDDGLADMQAMMGFGGFGTTHQQKVAGNEIYAVRKEKKTEYRQYMNRVGGFNRPLSPTRES